MKDKIFKFILNLGRIDWFLIGMAGAFFTIGVQPLEKSEAILLLCNGMNPFGAVALMIFTAFVIKNLVQLIIRRRRKLKLNQKR